MASFRPLFFVALDARVNEQEREEEKDSRGLTSLTCMTRMNVCLSCCYVNKNMGFRVSAHGHGPLSSFPFIYSRKEPFAIRVVASLHDVGRFAELTYSALVTSPRAAVEAFVWRIRSRGVSDKTEIPSCSPCPLAPH